MNQLEYCYLASEKNDIQEKPIMAGFVLDGDAAQAWSNQKSSADNKYSERIHELDEYLGLKAKSRQHPDAIYVIEHLHLDNWLIKGYLCCQKSAQALCNKNPDELRHTMVNLIHI